MSWGEVFKINKNMKRALNEQIRDLKCTPIRVITTTGTYSPEKTGLYKVICVGAGSDSLKFRLSSSSANTSSLSFGITNGSAGGVAIKDIRLVKGTSYNVTVSTTASFSNVMSATAGVTASYSFWTSSTYAAEGGTASGGDFNYTGQKGVGARDYTIVIDASSQPFTITSQDDGRYINGTSVGVVLTDICNNFAFADGNQGVWYGTSILTYGAGAPALQSLNNVTASSNDEVLAKGLPAAVIIIPIEMEE